MTDNSNIRSPLPSILAFRLTDCLCFHSAHTLLSRSGFARLALVIISVNKRVNSVLVEGIKALSVDGCAEQA
jgi:hypothetical protein